MTDESDRPLAIDPALVNVVVTMAVRAVLVDFLMHYRTADQILASSAGVSETAQVERQPRLTSPPPETAPIAERLRPEVLDHVATIYAEAAEGRREREALRQGAGARKH